MRPDTAAVSEMPQPPAFGLAGRVVAGAVVSSFLFGYSICVLNSCGDLIAVAFEWCGNEWQSDCIASRGSQGLVNASVYLGAALGALMSGRSWLSALGSRWQLIISDVYYVAGALICSLSTGVGTLILGRFASGLGLGISAIAAPLLIAEISPRERRGVNAAMNGVFITMGILASIAFGIPQSPPPAGPEERLVGLDEWYWRCLLGLPLVFACIQAAWFLWAYPVDAPSALVVRGELDLARRVLYRTYGLSASEELDADRKGQAALELQLKELREAADAARALPPIKVIQAMCDPFLRTAVFVGLALTAFSQLCGINGLMAYSNSLFAEAGITPQSLTLASTAMATANVAASLLSSRMVDHWGRRKLLMMGSFCQTLSMALLSALLDKRSQAWLPAAATGPAAVICFTVFVMNYSFGLGAVTWMYLSEIYPMEIRGPSLSACGVINWLCSAVVVFGTRLLSLTSACHIFGLICLFGFLGIWAWVVETKGCSMDDSPLTPKSKRASSPLLTPVNLNSPRGDYKKMEDDDDDDEESSLQGDAVGTCVR